MIPWPVPVRVMVPVPRAVIFADAPVTWMPWLLAPAPAPPPVPVTLILQLVQAVIDPAPIHQLGVAADLADLAVVQHDNAVGVADRRQAVGD